MNAFVVNRHGRLVFPSNFIPELDFSAIETLEQLDSVIRRDFETKAPSGTEILEKLRTERLRQPLRADARPGAEPVLGQPVRDDHVREAADPLGGRAAHAARRLPAGPGALGGRRDARSPPSRTAYPDAAGAVGRRPWRTGSSRCSSTCSATASTMATALPAIKPTVAEFLADPDSLTFRLPDYDPDYPVYDYTDIIDCSEDVPELEALHRWAMVLHNQYPWDRSQAELVRRSASSPTTTTSSPSTRGTARCAAFLRRSRLKSGVQSRPAPKARESAASRCGPSPRSTCAGSSRCMPRIEALAAVHGDQVCTNDDLIRNTAYNWSPMSADEIRDKTGIEERRYSSPAPGGARAAGRRGGAGEGRAGAGGDRRRPRLHLHQLPADPVGGHLDLRSARHLPDPRRLRHRRRLRGHALRPGRGHPAPAGGRAAGAGGLRRRSSPTRSATSGRPG